jgi:putative endopeptidase
MIKHWVLVSVASVGLVALAAPALSQQGGAKAAAAATKAAPKFGSWGVDTAGMDRTMKPGDNFYDYVNGKWVKETEIPADQSSWGGFTELNELSTLRTREVLEAAAKSNAAPGTNARKIGDYYTSFMDEGAIEAKGISPLKPYLAKIDAIKSHKDLARAFGEANRMGIGNPVSGGVGVDVKKNDQHAVSIGQAGLGLPNRDYYLDDKNAKFLEVRAKYQKYVGNMLRLAGMSEPEARAQRIYDLEKKLAEVHWPLTELRQADKTYNEMSRAELEKNIPGFDWSAYFAALGLNDTQRIIVRTPSSLVASTKLVQAEPLQTWKDYLAFRTISSAAPLLPKAFVDENFAYAQALSGTPQLPARWKRGVGIVGNSMVEAVGELYVARYYPPEAKAKMDVLVGNLIKAMDKRLDGLAWMQPETRAKARTKLASFSPIIGYPSKWRDYSALRIVPGDALGNVFRSREFEFNRNLKKLGQPVDRDEWPAIFGPQTVNAWASFALNRITFPAAILQPPFFDLNADDAVNYGAIGAVIGHEISHHFDDQGRKYDPKGNLIDWWTPSDVANFKAGADKVVKQYAEYELFPGRKVNGELTLGENIADLAGLTIAYDAYKESLGGKPAPVIDGFTGEQRFFLGFGQAWRSKQRDEYAQQLLTIDFHAPDRVRPNVVRNFDPWYAAFNVKDGKLYLPPEERIRIW